MKVGFTGTRQGMSDGQKEAFFSFLQTYRPYVTELLHGGCIGADEEAAKMAMELAIWTNEFPGDKPELRTKLKSDETHHPQAMLKRNKVIVNLCELLFACPKEYQEVKRGSGTWATIRYARRDKKPVIVCWRDGAHYLTYNVGAHYLTYNDGHLFF